MSLLLAFDGAAPQPRLLPLRRRRDARFDNICGVFTVHRYECVPQYSSEIQQPARRSSVTVQLTAFLRRRL
jgi:hypothetical protein